MVFNTPSSSLLTRTILSTFLGLIPISYENREINANGCWIWKGQPSFKYGSLSTNGKPKSAHRASFELFNGHIPKGKVLLHACDTPACFNPEHLILGTQKDNMDDMRAKGRQKCKIGEDSRASKLTNAKVREIRNSMLKNSVLAKMYEVTQPCIHSVLSRKNWKHVV